MGEVHHVKVQNEDVSAGKTWFNRIIMTKVERKIILGLVLNCLGAKWLFNWMTATVTTTLPFEF